jgi:hypothetical protein
MKIAIVTGGSRVGRFGNSGARRSRSNSRPARWGTFDPIAGSVSTGKEQHSTGKEQHNE